MSKFVVVSLVLGSLIASCGESGEDSSAVSIEFAAVVGDEPFACGESYDGLGANSTSLTLSDLRFYVQDVAFITASGQEVPMENVDSIWQLPNVALLDFEDGCGDLGDEATNRTISGTLPFGDYVGIKFQMGVPFEDNHQNQPTAPAPLNLSSMWWNWQGGYKFLRIDSGNFSPDAWRMHLGSTGCDGDPQSGGTTQCGTPNRVEVELDDFNPATDVIVFDVAALVDGAALDENQDGTPVGCMAGPMDSDCAPMFDNLGLPFGGAEPAGPQMVFSAVERAAAPQ
jgi:uncharacterized repeat protein (TIGR04052 family)